MLYLGFLVLWASLLEQRGWPARVDFVYTQNGIQKWKKIPALIFDNYYQHVQLNELQNLNELINLFSCVRKLSLITPVD